MDCKNIGANLKACNCTCETCSRKGKCCECLAYHRRNDELPACCFSPEQERSYNRSVAYFFRCNSH